MKIRLLTILIIAAALSTPVLFRNSVSTIRSSNELTAISWLLAEHYGSGSYSVYPLVFNIDADSTGVLSVIQGSPSTIPPSLPLPEGVPFPLQYTQQGSAITIRFREVP
ncbi:hypothetical protein CSA37_03690 [Candidatus Fermentibacteria bacterium]|nr:MAG: hypothetical protein CSA37_03690 [Candidatus Fermentibacteria bacterium]